MFQFQLKYLFYFFTFFLNFFLTSLYCSSNSIFCYFCSISRPIYFDQIIFWPIFYEQLFERILHFNVFERLFWPFFETYFWKCFLTPMTPNVHICTRCFLGKPWIKMVCSRSKELTFGPTIFWSTFLCFWATFFYNISVSMIFFKIVNFFVLKDCRYCSPSTIGFCYFCTI